MKPFEYYSTIGVPYPSRSEKRAELEAEIDSKPLTASQRSSLMRELDDRLNEWIHESRKPYRERESQLTSEFWADCRTDLGYSKWLDENAVAALEAYAWDEGHGNGFSEIYLHLDKLVDLAKVIVKGAK